MVVVAAITWIAIPPTKKPEKISAVNFKRWQQWVFLWLATLGLPKFTNEETLVPSADMSDREKFMIVEVSKQQDFLCKIYILSAFEDDLYNVYYVMTTSKELSDALEENNKKEDACLKKFVVT